MKEAKHFYAAMYLRLSREDSDGEAVPASGDGHGLSKAESNSIGTQRELIRSFIKEQEDIELFDCYVDDNYSGSNFNRPEFKRMMQDIEAGRVNCAIVKDLSRFGRDYIETGGIWTGYSRLLASDLVPLPTVMIVFRRMRGSLHFLRIPWN